MEKDSCLLGGTCRVPLYTNVMSLPWKKNAQMLHREYNTALNAYTTCQIACLNISDGQPDDS